MRLFILLLSVLSVAVHADLVFHFDDEPGYGFYDETAAGTVGGNTGTTLGQQRQNVFLNIAEKLEEELNISAPVVVSVKFASLTCSADSAILGQAWAPEYAFDDDNMRITPHALHNQSEMRDVNPDVVEVEAFFNANISGNADCLYGANWYLGFDTAPEDDYSLKNVAMHELLHGLGFLSQVQVNGETTAWKYNEEGERAFFFDPYSEKLMSAVTGAMLTDMTVSQRSFAVRKNQKLVWTGENANRFSTDYSSGFFEGKAILYSPSTFKDGSSVSHFDISMSPDEIMEPFENGGNPSSQLSFAVLKDIGWPAGPTNLPPVLQYLDDITMSEDSIRTLTLVSSDPDRDSLTHTLVNPPASLRANLSGKTLTITPVANYNGTEALTIRVSDGITYTEQTIQVTVTPVNDLPVISVTGSTYMNEDTVATLTVSATDVDGDDIALSVTTDTNELSVSLSDSELRIEPVANYFGSGIVTISAFDGTATRNKNITITVRNVNDGPVISAISQQETEEDSPLQVSLGATDIDSETLVYSASTTSESVSLSVSGAVLQITPAPDFFGEADITVMVSDGRLVDSTDFHLVITSVNDAPEITPVSNKSMGQAATLEILLTGSDVDGDSLNYSVTNNPDNLNVSVTGNILSIVQNGEFTGTATLTATVSDGHLNDQTTFAVEVGLNNLAPVISAIEAQSMTEDTPLTIAVDISDPNGDAITVSYLSNVDGFSFELTEGMLTITPAADYFGAAEVNLTVSDGVLETSEVINLNIVAVNDAPVFDEVTGITVTEDSETQHLLAVTDVDDSSLIKRIVVADANLGARMSGGYLMLKPLEDFYGSGSLTMEVSDGELKDTVTVTVTVTPVNDPPFINSIAAQILQANGQISVPLSAGDVDSNGAVTISSSAPALISAELIDGQIVLNSPTGYNGTVTVTVVISDGEFSRTRTFTVTVSDGKAISELELHVKGNEVTWASRNPLFEFEGAEAVPIYMINRWDDWTAEIQYNDSQRNDLLTYNEQTGLASLVSPQTGAFAGEYQVTFRHKDGVARSVSFRAFRNPSLKFNADTLISGTDSGRMYIFGLPESALVEVIADHVQIVETTSGTQGPWYSPASSDSPNVLSLSLTADEVRSWQPSLPTVYASGFDEVSGHLRIYPATLSDIAIVDEQGRPVTGATIEVLNDDREGWGLSAPVIADESGTVSLTLPDTMDISMSVRAEGWYSQELSFAAGESDTITVVMIPKPESFVVHGQISAMNFDFTDELPVVDVMFEDGTTTPVTIIRVSDDILSFSWQWDWEGPRPTKLIVRHPSSLQSETHYILTPDLLDQMQDIVIWGEAIPDTTPAEQAPDADGSSSSGGGAVLWLLLCSFITVRRRKNVK